MVRVPEDEAAAPKMIDGALSASVPEVLVIWTLLKALVPFMVPVAVCKDEPLKVVVPLPAVKVPLLV